MPPKLVQIWVNYHLIKANWLTWKTNRLPDFTPKPPHIPKESPKKNFRSLSTFGEKNQKNAKQCSDFTHSLLLSSDSDNFPFPQTLRLLRFSHFSETISINRWRFNTLFVLKYLFFYRVIQASCCLALYQTYITIDYVSSSALRNSRIHPSLCAVSQRGRSNHRNTQKLQWTLFIAEDTLPGVEMENTEIFRNDCQTKK